MGEWNCYSWLHAVSISLESSKWQRSPHFVSTYQTRRMLHLKMHCQDMEKYQSLKSIFFILRFQILGSSFLSDEYNILELVVDIYKSFKDPHFTFTVCLWWDLSFRNIMHRNKLLFIILFISFFIELQLLLVNWNSGKRQRKINRWVLHNCQLNIRWFESLS